MLRIVPGFLVIKSSRISPAPLLVQFERSTLINNGPESLDQNYWPSD
jgi:hypothetical protein